MTVSGVFTLPLPRLLTAPFVFRFRLALSVAPPFGLPSVTLAVLYLPTCKGLTARQCATAYQFVTFRRLRVLVCPSDISKVRKVFELQNIFTNIIILFYYNII